MQRLHQLVALRGFGLCLAEIGQMPDGAGADPRELIRRQLAQVEERVAVAHRLRRTLLGVLGAFDSTVEPSVQQLVELIEVMTAMPPSRHASSLNSWPKDAGRWPNTDTGPARTAGR